jgi:hypothetical protein
MAQKIPSMTASSYDLADELTEAEEDLLVVKPHQRTLLEWHGHRSRSLPRRIIR